MKTGNTGEVSATAGATLSASMEPGHEDREYPDGAEGYSQRLPASMEPGHEDREYRDTSRIDRT